MEGKEGASFQKQGRAFCSFSARPDGLGESAGCCYASLGRLAVKSENPKSLPTACKNKGKNVVSLERLILSKCHLFILSQPSFC